MGDFDVFALPVILRETGKSLDEVLSILANQSGLEGMSGAGRDLRDIEEAAAKGDSRAELAIDVFVAAIRHYLGAYLLELNGADAIVFTGGIGENSVRIRTAVCRELDWFGIALDPALESGRTGRTSRLDARLARAGVDGSDQRRDRGRPAVEAVARTTNPRVKSRCSWPGSQAAWSRLKRSRR